MRIHLVRLLTACALGAALCGCPAAAAQAPADDPVAQAIASMRRVKPADLSGDREKAKADELDRAWKTLADAGPKGAAGLRAEIARIDATGEKDDFFKLGAAVVLWRIGRIDEASEIATLWSDDVDLALNYSYVFYVAFDAADTRDARVVPMLSALLRDQQGKVFVAAHSLTLAWPLSHQFVWGRFGSGGSAALLRVFEDSKDDTTLASTIALLAQRQEINALERIRSLARDGTGRARVEAIKALGLYGHPQDYEFLVAGLKRGSDDAYASAYALYEYGDLRAVPELIPLLSAADERPRTEALGALVALPTVEGIEALTQCAAGRAGAPDARQMCRQASDAVLGKLELSAEAFAAKSPARKADLVTQLRATDEARYRVGKDDKQLTHELLLKAAEEWKTNHRISGGTYQWVEDRHVLAAAGVGDIPLLLDVEAACLGRLSDESLYEVATLTRIVQRLGRTRYRAEVGVTEKVRSIAGS